MQHHGKRTQSYQASEKQRRPIFNWVQSWSTKSDSKLLLNFVDLIIYSDSQLQLTLDYSLQIATALCQIQPSLSVPEKSDGVPEKGREQAGKIPDSHLTHFSSQ